MQKMVIFDDHKLSAELPRVGSEFGSGSGSVRVFFGGSGSEIFLDPNRPLIEMHVFDM